MDTAIVPSTFLLTLLLSVGLFFFIRASTKDRIEKARLVSPQGETAFMKQLKEYFQSRAYSVKSIDQQQNQVTFEGFVRPSWFLAIFLSFLAAVGLACLSLVLSQLFDAQRPFFLFLVLLCPLSGIFYWRKSGRIEQVLLKVDSSPDEQHSSSVITVVAHRDELAELQRALQLKTLD